MKTLLIVFLLANSPTGMTSIKYERQFLNETNCWKAAAMLRLNESIKGKWGDDLRWRIVTQAECVAP